MMIPTSGFAMGQAKALNKKAQGWRALRPGKEPVLKQRRALRHPHDGRAGDLVVPGLAFRIEDHPHEAETGHSEREETAQRAHHRRRPVERPVVEAHHAEAPFPRVRTTVPQLSANRHHPCQAHQRSLRRPLHLTLTLRPG